MRDITCYAPDGFHSDHNGLRGLYVCNNCGYTVYSYPDTRKEETPHERADDYDWMDEDP